MNDQIDNGFLDFLPLYIFVIVGLVWYIISTHDRPNICKNCHTILKMGDPEVAKKYQYRVPTHPIDEVVYVDGCENCYYGTREIPKND